MDHSCLWSYQIRYDDPKVFIARARSYGQEVIHVVTEVLADGSMLDLLTGLIDARVNFSALVPTCPYFVAQLVYTCAELTQSRYNTLMMTAWLKLIIQDTHLFRSTLAVIFEYDHDQIVRWIAASWIDGPDSLSYDLLTQMEQARVTFPNEIKLVVITIIGREMENPGSWLDLIDVIIRYPRYPEADSGVMGALITNFKAALDAGSVDQLLTIIDQAAPVMGIIYEGYAFALILLHELTQSVEAMLLIPDLLHHPVLISHLNLLYQASLSSIPRRDALWYLTVITRSTHLFHVTMAVWFRRRPGDILPWFYLPAGGDVMNRFVYLLHYHEIPFPQGGKDEALVRLRLMMEDEELWDDTFTFLRDYPYLI